MGCITGNMIGFMNFLCFLFCFFFGRCAVDKFFICGTRKNFSYQFLTCKVDCFLCHQSCGCIFSTGNGDDSCDPFHFLMIQKEHATADVSAGFFSCGVKGSDTGTQSQHSCFPKFRNDVCHRIFHDLDLVHSRICIVRIIHIYRRCSEKCGILESLTYQSVSIGRGT